MASLWIYASQSAWRNFPLAYWLFMQTSIDELLARCVTSSAVLILILLTASFDMYSFPRIHYLRGHHQQHDL
jgi:hypothetical protein